MNNYPALTDAYREYLDRMVEMSEDLVEVDQFTVPMAYNTDALSEWCELS